MSDTMRNGLRQALLDAQLASVAFRAADGVMSVGIRDNENAADVATDAALAYLAARPATETRIAVVGRRSGQTEALVQRVADAAAERGLPVVVQESPAVDAEAVAEVLSKHRGVDTLWTDKQRCACGARPDRNRSDYIGFGDWHRTHQAEQIAALLPTAPEVVTGASDETLTVMQVRTRHPQDYTLRNAQDGTSWRIENGRWVRAAEQSEVVTTAADAWDEGFRKGQASEASDPALWTASKYANPYRPTAEPDVTR